MYIYLQMRGKFTRFKDNFGLFDTIFKTEKCQESEDSLSSGNILQRIPVRACVES